MLRLSLLLRHRIGKSPKATPIKFDGGDPAGEFTGLKGTIQFDEKDLAGSKFDMTVDVAWINTGNGMKNTHAKSPNWFDAEQYPTIGFTSSSIKKTADGFETVGTLEMHGVKKEDHDTLYICRQYVYGKYRSQQDGF